MIGDKDPASIEIKELIGHNDFEILKVYNEKWLSNKILHPRIQKPGLALAGYLKYLDKDRLQIFGNTEMGYLKQLPRPEFENRLNKFMAARIPAIIVSGNQEVEQFIIERADKNKTPILVSNLRTSLLMSRISTFLYRLFSQKIRINGVLMDIMGQGILIQGQSGIGKSETALELINKGHRLISDDLVEFYLNSNDEPVGRSIEKIRNWLEVRGLGVINIVDIFGVGAVLEEKKLDLVISLEKWDPKIKYDRLGAGNLYMTILGKDIPKFNVPVALGRNLSILIEAAVKYFISRKNGSRSFIDHLTGNGIVDSNNNFNDNNSKQGY
ncbi:MAG TPA: HPr(Ser) kinase/phosphatase [Candidatus Deferrimicrobium sp.]|nr:HPr(Ser) kinase/phosphatase [Candidatus Kapabacteria bacterium]HLP58724.1 HPr(Ser) kinase/phosphatase [Candidatus Deferrimicrobium sp.]